MSLDNGDSRLLRQGDIVVKRTTMHALCNVSRTEAARLIYSIVDFTQPISAGGKELKKDMNVLAGEYADAEKEDQGAHVVN